MGITFPCSVITSPGSAAHDIPGHPECEERLRMALSGVPHDIPARGAEAASEEDLALVHDPSYFRMVKERCRALQAASFLDADTYITPSSYTVAVQAAGSAIAAIERSLDGEHCFALIRPPGHHAERGRAMGFCIFNNVAIAAAAALKSVSRVAIVDWDYHHGNGTQHAFYDSAEVLFCSVHHGGTFPWTGSVAELGIGNGEGYTINAPLEAGSVLADYAAVFSGIFAPALRRFDPDAVLVSAGQDTLFDDPLGRMRLTPPDFEVLTRIIAGSAVVPLALVLEGGYSQSHGTAISHIFRGLRSGEPVPECPPLRPSPNTEGLVSTLRKIHRL